MQKHLTWPNKIALAIARVTLGREKVTIQLKTSKN